MKNKSVIDGEYFNTVITIDYENGGLFIAEGSSGCTYKPKSKKELLEYVCNYVLDCIDTDNQFSVEIKERKKIMSYYLVFIKEEYVRDAQAYEGPMESEEDIFSDYQSEQYWKDAGGPLLVFEGYAKSEEEILDKLKPLYPQADASIFMFYQFGRKEK